MTDSKKYAVPVQFSEKTYLNESEYHALYRRSVEDPEGFWGEQAQKFLSWSSPWQSVKTGGFEKLDTQWFTGGKLNACYNCVDRHLEKSRDRTAILWEGDDPDNIRRISWAELHADICRFANVLKKHGVKKGDRVCIYLPMVPEAAVAMLACARIGAIHSVVFAGFSPDALKTRILDADAATVITADESLRSGKITPLKKNVDSALASCPGVSTVIVVRRTSNPVPMDQKRDCWYHTEITSAPEACPPEPMDANDPLFILYTSGSTGKPKGVLHTVGGYLVYAAVTHHYIFDCRPSDIYWCTADIGWITGHTYLVYGPLTNGITTLMYEGTPSHPTFSRFWEIIDRHEVSIFYTAPTAIRALRRQGDEWVTHTQRSSLRLLGTVGEPINPDVWEWYYRTVGDSRCPVIDTWWQTETGGILISPLPGATPLKPGSAAWPFFGIQPDIVNEKGQPVKNNETGKLVIRAPWPGLMQTLFGNHQRFVDTYFKEIPGSYLTGDSAYRDHDGYYWIVGRDDDVIKVSGHRLGTGELESAFITHPAISEAAVVAIPDEIKGQAIYAYIVPKEGTKPSDALAAELITHVRNTMGPVATPKIIQWAPELPKTRSGKIMRRILRKIAVNDLDNLGDVSTLTDPDIVDTLITGHKEIAG